MDTSIATILLEQINLQLIILNTICTNMPSSTVLLIMQFVETCPHLILSNGRVDYNKDPIIARGFHYPEFTWATFICAPGYRLFGAPRRNCFKGIWTQQTPTCKLSNETFFYKFGEDFSFFRATDTTVLHSW